MCRPPAPSHLAIGEGLAALDLVGGEARRGALDAVEAIGERRRIDQPDVKDRCRQCRLRFLAGASGAADAVGRVRGRPADGAAAVSSGRT